MKKYNVFCSNDPNSGNPALVRDDALLQDSVVLQTQAREFNYPVMVCLFPSEKKQQPATIRFFYPSKETNICVHGALAAACHLLHGKNPHHTVTVVNKEGEPLIFSKNEEQYFVTLNPVSQIEKTFNADEVLSMLNIDESDMDLSLPFKIASAGSQKMLIPIADLPTLANLQPDFERIAQWSQENAVNGFYPYTADTEDTKADFHARNFNPLTGLNEDVATGIAAAALASCFIELNPTRTFKIEQGLFLKKPCLIYVSVEDGKLKVGGNVEAMV